VKVGKAIVAYYSRYAMVFATFLFTLTALVFSINYGNRGIIVSLTMSVVIAFAYYILLSDAILIGKNGLMDPKIVVWIPNALYVLMLPILYGRLRR